MAKQELGATHSKKTIQWRERLARFTASGRQVGAFCRSESVSEASFYRWRKQLNGTVNAQETTSRFIDAGAMAAAPSGIAAAYEHQRPPDLELRLELGHGLVLHIVRR